MALRHVDPDEPGWTRRRAGRGFSYRDLDGTPVSGEERDRIAALAIPPAWTEVWICPDADGHLQAVGTDEAGRRQYLYHPEWREHRDEEKFRRVQEFGLRLPRVRRRVTRDLSADEMTLSHSCALALRLVDDGCFRIGNDMYAEEHGSFGLTTIEQRHVRRAGDTLRFRFVGKSGVEHDIVVSEARCVRDLTVLRRRRGDFEQLLAFRDEGVWHRLTPASVNGYLQEIAEMTVTVKDFRTWHATTLAARLLAGHRDPATVSAERSALRHTMEEVADFLGNTPAVARSSYVDPRVLEHFAAGRTIPPELAGRASRRDRARVERAVLELLSS